MAEYSKQYNKQYYQDPVNKERQKQYMKQYSKQYYQDNKMRLHELSPEQRAERRAYRQEYYKNNKKAFSERQRRLLDAQRNVVYSLRNIYNGKEYIGSTTTYQHRMSGHRSQLRRGVHRSKDMQKDYDLHGLFAFEFNVLYEMSKEDYTESVLREKEREIIENISISGGTLYNHLHVARQRVHVAEDYSDGKTCPTCGEFKRPPAFSLNSKEKSGLDTYCKECRHDRYIARKAKTKDKKLP